jgi:cardiolipin synthase
MSMNMFTHRKILVADGHVGITGGMNIRVGHCPQYQPPNPVQNIHFRVKGPVVSQLQEVFTDDWLFTISEALRGDLWFPKSESEGQVSAQGATVQRATNRAKFWE